ncbi:uncharacterized protein METZ01_LOCUS207292, partial [marine metagenome]
MTASFDRRNILGMKKLASLCLLLPFAVFSEDWPTWRADPGRSAATAETLASELHLQWV